YAPMSEKTYRDWPRVEPALWTLGVSTKDVHATLADNNFRGFVAASHCANVQILEAPLHRHLVAGQAKKLRIHAPNCGKMEVINPVRQAAELGDFKRMNLLDGVHEALLEPVRGKLMIVARFPDTKDQTILEY